MAEPFKPMKPPGFKDPGQPVAIPIQPPPGMQVHPSPFKNAPPHLRRRSRGRGCCCYCCCIFWIVIFILIFATLVAAAIIYFIYDPKPPILRLQSFRVPKFNVTDKIDGSYMDVDTVARMEVRNPNGKIRFEFGRTRFAVWVDEGDVGLGSGTVAAFTVKEKEVVSVKAETRVRGQVVDDAHRKSLVVRFEKKQVVPNVEAKTKIKLNFQGWKMGSLKINVVCGGVPWANLEAGRSPKCTITTLKWIKI